MAGILSSLASNLLSSFYGEPQQNPNYESPVYDPTSGGFVDPKTGMPSSDQPMRNPGFWERTLAPQTAATESAINREYNMAPSEAQLKYNSALVPTVNNYNALTPSEQSTVGSSPASMYAHYGNSPVTSGMVNEAAGAQQFNAKGGIDETTKNRLQSLATSTQDQSNLYSKLSKLAELEEPTTSAYNEAANAGLTSRKLIHEGEVLPSKFNLDTLGTGNDVSLAQGLKERIPDINATEANKAYIARGMSDTERALLPTSQYTMGNNATVGAYESAHPALNTQPYYNPVDRGEVGPTERNTNFMPNQFGLMNMMAGGMGQPQVHTGPDGTQYQIAPEKPHGWRPPITSNNKDEDVHPAIQEAVKEAQDAHDKYGPNSPYYQQKLEELKKAHLEHGTASILGNTLKGTGQQLISPITVPYWAAVHATDKGLDYLGHKFSGE